MKRRGLHYNLPRVLANGTQVARERPKTPYETIREQRWKAIREASRLEKEASRLERDAKKIQGEEEHIYQLEKELGLHRKKEQYEGSKIDWAAIAAEMDRYPRRDPHEIAPPRREY